MTEPNPFPVRIHPFQSQTPNSCAYEYAQTSTPNALVFIGGLTEGPHSNHNVRVLIDHFQKASELGFTVWEFHMRSSYTGFGYSGLSNDGEDISSFVKYLRQLGKEKIVLMGASTGCQGCLEYTKHEKYDNLPVDGYILCNPVSDRETASFLMPKEALDHTIATAQAMIDDGRKDDAMPRAIVPPIFSSPVTAYRWNSLAEKGGDDDFFSSDFDDETISKIFGSVDKPILIMPGGKDELVPPTVDKDNLLQRWMKACPEGTASGECAVNPGADHNISEEPAQQWMLEKTTAFLKKLS